MISKILKSAVNIDSRSSDAPGKLKLIEALKHLLDEKDFNSITTAEIAKTANANEALIYWHFQDKRGLLHQVLREYLQEHMALLHTELKKITDPLEKLKKLMWLSFDIWNKNTIYAKIILIEVRSFPGYFESESYMIVRNYAGLIKQIVSEGMKKGEIRDDIPSSFIRDLILGGIEHYVLPALIFNRKISPDTYTEYLSKILFEGILIQKKQITPKEKKT